MFKTICPSDIVPSTALIVLSNQEWANATALSTVDPQNNVAIMYDDSLEVDVINADLVRCQPVVWNEKVAFYYGDAVVRIPTGDIMYVGRVVREAPSALVTLCDVSGSEQVAVSLDQIRAADDVDVLRAEVVRLKQELARTTGERAAAAVQKPLSEASDLEKLLYILAIAQNVKE